MVQWRGRKEGKTMKKITAIILAAFMVLSLAACGGSSAASTETNSKALAAAPSSSASIASTASDSDAIKEKGTFVVGITDFEPMDYKDEKGEWIGFDADVAKLFAESLGVDVQFVEIEWDNKILELNAGTIDCVWNGMTLTSEVTSAMDCSKAYCNNAQVVIVPKAIADQSQDIDSVKDLVFAVEAGSAGAAEADANGFEYTEVTNQAAALMEVAAKTCDAAIIDSLMAAAMVGEGTSYEDLTYTVALNSEEYGVGFRKGSDLPDLLNKFLKEKYDDGTLGQIAETYGVTAALIAQ